MAVSVVEERDGPKQELQVSTRRLVLELLFRVSCGPPSGVTFQSHTSASDEVELQSLLG